VLNAEFCRDATFKLRNQGTTVGQPMSIEGPGNAIEDRLFVRQIRPPNMYWFSKRGLVAENREARPMRRQ
jgi:hypothetical protein